MLEMVVNEFEVVAKELLRCSGWFVGCCKVVAKVFFGFAKASLSGC